MGPTVELKARRGHQRRRKSWGHSRRFPIKSSLFAMQGIRTVVRREYFLRIRPRLSWIASTAYRYVGTKGTEGWSKVEEPKKPVTDRLSSSDPILSSKKREGISVPVCIARALRRKPVLFVRLILLGGRTSEGVTISRSQCRRTSRSVTILHRARRFLRSVPVQPGETLRRLVRESERCAVF